MGGVGDGFEQRSAAQHGSVSGAGSLLRRSRNPSSGVAMERRRRRRAYLSPRGDSAGVGGDEQRAAARHGSVSGDGVEGGEASASSSSSRGSGFVCVWERE